jgi:transposase
MAANVAVAQDPAGNLKPAKDKSTKRLDGQLPLYRQSQTFARQGIEFDCSTLATVRLGRRHMADHDPVLSGRTWMRRARVDGRSR